MATTLKILGQIKPAAATLAEVYEVPSSTQASAVLFVCNQGAAATTYKLALTGGTSPGATEYIAFNAALAIGESVQYSGIGLDATKAIWASSVSGDVSFVATGTEEA